MNCKNCGAPVDGHIACTKCGQLVDFSGGISQSEPRSSYGINWGTEETPAATSEVESTKEIKAEPVADNSVKTAPVVAESRTDTSENESEDTAIFATFSEAMNDIAEDMVAIGDDMKEDIAAEDKEEEPYRYKENKYEFSGSAKSSGTYNSGTYNNSKKNNDDVDSKPTAFSLFLFFAFIIMALVISGTRNNKEDEYEKARQELYDNIDLESLQNMYGLNLHSSSSPSTVEEEPVVYIYADLGKIYNTDGECIEINEDAIVKSDLNHQRIAYYQDGQLYLVDGDLEPESVASNVKDFKILPKLILLNIF